MKQEEILLLEGFRFIDRLGKADSKLCRDVEEPTSIPAAVESLDNDITPISSSEVGSCFVRSKAVPAELRSYYPCECDLSLAESKNIKKEFERLNNDLLTSLKNNRKKKYNVPKVARDSIGRLKRLVKDKVIDIRKVDKGQVILITDYHQRLLTEERNISLIAELCPDQVSNWEQNKDFAEEKMKSLFFDGFVSKSELTAVTGLIAGGVDGCRRNKDGSMKFTQVVSQKELFCQQSTPYVYPLYKAHKLPKEILLQVDPGEVHQVIPSRLVVGMGNCQLSRVQKWLESFLTPLSKLYGKFEFIKDSNDFLLKLETIKSIASTESWDMKNMLLFTVDVKVLYPSVQIQDVSTSLQHCFENFTDWSEGVRSTLVDLIIYTLKNQQIK